MEGGLNLPWCGNFTYMTCVSMVRERLYTGNERTYTMKPVPVFLFVD